MKMTGQTITRGLIQAYNFSVLGRSALLKNNRQKALKYFEKARNTFNTELSKEGQSDTRELWESEQYLVEQEINKLNMSLDDKTARLLETDRENTDFKEQIIQMRDVQPKTGSWPSTIIGLDHVKRTLDNVIGTPLEKPESWKSSSKPPRRVLLFGPPGCGKTEIAKALPVKTGLPLYNVTSGKILSKWFGESEKKIEQLFQRAYQEPEGCILFFDEFDALVGKVRDESSAMERIRMGFLAALDGYNVPTPNKVVVIAITNRPDRLEGAMMRRFDRRVYVPPPGYSEIYKLIEYFTRNIKSPIELSSEAWQRTIRSMLGLTAKEISDIVHGAIWNCCDIITNDQEITEVFLRNKIKELHSDLTPYFCTFEAVEPSVYLFLDHQYGFPKTNHKPYSWEVAYMKRKHELIKKHPKPQIIYRRKSMRQM